MNKDIQILQNGRLQETLQLGNGTYRLGRDPSADIVLADSAISKTHATLTIDNDNFLIKDNGSANGIFLQGKKFIEQQFKNTFEIEIRPFTIRTTNTAPDSAQTGIDEKAHAAANAVRRFSINNIKSSIFLIFGITMLLTILIGYFPLKNQATAISRQEILKTGILLTRYLAEMNRPFLESGQKDMVRTSPVNLEDGVIYAFVIDAQGRIIAPHEKQGDFFNWPGLSNAFAGSKLKIEDGTQNEKIIFYPIVLQNQNIGAAIIGFANQQTGKSTSGMGAMAIFLLAILFVIGMLMSHLLAKAFLNPLKSLYEEVEIAIKKGGHALDYQAPYQELDNLKRAFDRLLMRKTSASPSVTSDTRPPKPEASVNRPASNEKPSLLDATGVPPSRPASIDTQLKGITSPWCMIDRETYTLKQLSDNFAPILGTPECREGMHIIEALETDIIPAVSQMIDSEADKLSVAHADKAYTLRRIHTMDAGAAGKNNVILVFEDNAE